MEMNCKIIEKVLKDRKVITGEKREREKEREREWEREEHDKKIQK